MSINITVHGNPVNINKDKILVNDTEYALKIESERRKKIRLEQVRQQSKEIASQLRNKVNLEREKQLRRVERIKSNELRNWQDREVDRKQKEYRKCLSKVGEAHLAAAAECDVEQKQKEIKLKNDAIAIQRGKDAAAKLKITKDLKKKVNRKCKSVSTQVDDQILGSSSEDDEEEEVVKKNNGGFTKSNDGIIPTFKSKYFPQGHLYPEIQVQDISSDSDSEIIQRDIELNQAKTTHSDDSCSSSNESSEIVEIGKKLSIPKQIYNHKEFAATSSSESASFPIASVPSSIPLSCSSENQQLPFSEISNLIKNRQIAKEQRSVRFTSEPIDMKNLIKSPLKSRLSNTRNSPIKTQIISPKKSIQTDPLNIPSINNHLISSSKEIKSVIKPKPVINTGKTSVELKGHTPSIPASFVEPQKVQMYDNWSKFSKEYIPSNDLVVREKIIPGVPNAMEEAQKAIELDRKKLLELEEMRKRENLRSEKVVEREQIRKDYELMSTQLEALSKEEKSIRTQIHPENRFSEEKMRQSEREREKRLNTVFEDILKKPVIITCPPVNDNYRKKSSDLKEMNTINVASSKYAIDSGQIMNSSDSCSSILLGYVDDRSRELSERICQIDGNNQILSNSKIVKLNELLEKINDQKRLIAAESNKDQTISSDVMDQILKFLQNWEKDKKNVLRENKSDEENKRRAIDEEKRLLEKREQLLRDREFGLEGKIRELCKKEIEREKKKIEINNASKEQQKHDEQLPQQQTQRKIESHKLKNIEIGSHGNCDYEDSVMSNDASTDVPVKIIITLNDKGRKRKKCPREKTIKLMEDSNPRKFFPKTPIKKQLVSESNDDIINSKPFTMRHLQKKKQDINDESVTTSISTAYRSPPSRISNHLDMLFDKSRENDEKIKNDKNPILTHYINKLLGMSRQSIDRLEVSSLSDVQTPTDSIINVTGNMLIESELQPAQTITTTIDDSRVERIRKFINDNHSFSSDIESSFRRTSSTNSSADESRLKEIQEILKRNFELSQKKAKTLKPALKKKQPQQNQQPILDNEISNKKKKIILKSPPEVIIPPSVQKIQKNSTSNDDENLDKRYNELTENCSQRIANLSELITKVREEKQRLIENSLSSKSDNDCNAQNSTEYMDFASPKDDDSSRISELKSLSYKDDELQQRNEAGKKLTEQRQIIGTSRDSGISISRPLTSTDQHDSPDIRPQISGILQDDLLILKEIPKVRDIDKFKLEDFLAIGGNLDIYKEILEKRNRPPISLKRYSPKLDDDRPHELSTIAEVETPITSRINISTIQNDIDDDTIEKNETIQSKIFPTYDEYKENEELNKIFNNFINNDENVQLDYKKFPTRSEYNKENNITNEIESINLEGSGLDIENNNHPDIDKQNLQSIGSDSSLPDVVAELKRRNIMDRSFDNSPERIKCLSPVNNENIITPSNNNQVVIDNQHSPKKGKTNIKLGLKTPPKTKQKDNKMVLTPKKNPSPNKIVLSKKGINSKNVEEETDNKKDHSLSGIGMLSSNSDKTMEGFEKDLDKVGLKWASIMLKTTKKSMALQSTSSTSSPNIEQSHKKSPQKSKQNTTTGDSFVDPNIACSSRHIIESSFVSDESSCAGKPLNLKDFLARELMKRINPENNSSSSDSSSLASLFLKSLLSASSSSIHELGEQEKIAHRTSTPVTKYSSSTSSKIFSLNASSGLFSGESKLSSVKSHDETNINNIDKSESLIVPNLKLNTDKYTTKSDSSST